MSKQYPECPLYNHVTCKDLHNPKVCALIREDKCCFKKRQKSKPHENGNDNEHENGYAKESDDEKLRRT
ncbi:MAG: hypothetical protein HQK64_00645 [Desulfamplus sp.]|nr:hypothetical protein [Desulfamplus sp.]MBF0389706.1 hypothetical protein [Desulfamplus sp.]